MKVYALWVETSEDSWEVVHIASSYSKAEDYLDKHWPNTQRSEFEIEEWEVDEDEWEVDDV